VLQQPERDVQDKLYRVSEAAELLGVSMQTVRNLIHSGQLSAYRLSPKRFMIPVSSIQAFLMAHKA
jgi:excisionase family DNA binding protein